jgi:hypothetical protein
MTLQYTYYTDKLKANVAGQANGPIVAINPKYKTDKGLHEHEYVHVNQFYLCWFIAAVIVALVVYFLQLNQINYFYCLTAAGTHGILYLLLKPYRLWAEVSAYKEQLKHYPDDKSDKFAGYITNYYDLDVKKEAVLIKLNP